MLGCSGAALAGTPAGMRRVNQRALLARPPCVRRRSCGLVIRAAAEVKLAAHAEPINAEEFVEQHGEIGEKLLEEAPIMARCLGGSSIFLIGMMGCGKSTIGKLAARLLRYDFCDTDDMIEEKAGKTIAQIFEDEGEEHFRGLETEVLTELADVKRAVVSTGGGAAARIENWGNMQSGLVVYLDGSAELLAKRIVEKDGTGSRPMLAGSDSDLKKTEERIAKLLDERRSYYQKADIIVPLEESGASDYGSSPEEVTLRMLMSLDTKTLSWPEE